MSKLFDKLVSKILAVIVVVLFVAAFREMILTDSSTSTVFGALMGTLPFAKVIVDAVCKILKYRYEIPVLSASGTVNDLLRLAVMAFLQPIVMGPLTRIFLPIPRQNQILATSLRSYEMAEAYMNSPRYRIKELLLKIISAPLLALAASWITAWIFEFIQNSFGGVATIFLGLVSVILLGALSLGPLVMSGVAVGTAIAWRILITFGSKMITTFGTNVLCLAIYVAILGGVSHQVAMTVAALIIWLIFMDFGVKSLQKAIVG